MKQKRAKHEKAKTESNDSLRKNENLTELSPQHFLQLCSICGSGGSRNCPWIDGYIENPRWTEDSS
jgi:hypothetical protein